MAVTPLRTRHMPMALTQLQTRHMSMAVTPLPESKARGRWRLGLVVGGAAGCHSVAISVAWFFSCLPLTVGQAVRSLRWFMWWS